MKKTIIVLVVMALILVGFTNANGEGKDNGHSTNIERNTGTKEIIKETIVGAKKIAISLYEKWQSREHLCSQCEGTTHLGNICIKCGGGNFLEGLGKFLTQVQERCQKQISHK